MSRTAFPIVYDMKIRLFSETGFFAFQYPITFRPAFIEFRACYFAINPNLVTFARLKANNIMNLSVIEHSNNTKQRRLAYVPARIKVIHINAQRVICQSGSGGNSSLGETTLDENNFEQL